MAELYAWFVVLHLVGLVVFTVCHGVSGFVAFRIRGERDPAVVAALLELSRLSIGPMYLGLVALLLGGIGAAWGADLWFEPWIIASAIVLVVVLAVMYSVATPYYIRVREAIGAASTDDGRPSADAVELARLLDSRRPEILVTVGSVGLLVLIWLMVVKPG